MADEAYSFTVHEGQRSQIISRIQNASRTAEGVEAVDALTAIIRIRLLRSPGAVRVDIDDHEARTRKLFCKSSYNSRRAAAAVDHYNSGKGISITCSCGYILVKGKYASVEISLNFRNLYCA